MQSRRVFTVQQQQAAPTSDQHTHHSSSQQQLGRGRERESEKPACVCKCVAKRERDTVSTPSTLSHPLWQDQLLQGQLRSRHHGGSCDGGAVSYPAPSLLPQAGPATSNPGESSGHLRSRFAAPSSIVDPAPQLLEFFAQRRTNVTLGSDVGDGESTSWRESAS